MQRFERKGVENSEQSPNTKCKHDVCLEEDNHVHTRTHTWQTIEHQYHRFSEKVRYTWCALESRMDNQPSNKDRTSSIGLEADCKMQNFHSKEAPMGPERLTSSLTACFFVMWESTLIDNPFAFSISRKGMFISVDFDV